MSVAPVSAVIALGSNLGDRETTLREALADLAALDGVTVTAASSIIETAALKPAGIDHDAPSYLNAIVLVSTALEPDDLLDALNAIELNHGRVREERWGDRTLDLDIVSYDGITMQTERLTLPHPRAGERDFVLVPWRQVDPDAILPGVGRIDELPLAHETVQVWRSAALL